MASNQKRVLKELTECTKDPPQGTRVRLVDESDVMRWEVLMDGPDGSVYAGGHFRLLLTLPPEYPFKPPALHFTTKIYHPNVSNDDKGSMCLPLLRSDAWKPPNRIAAVLRLARQMLSEPNPDDAVEASIADQFKNQRREFDKVAKEWVKKYAGVKL